MKLSSKLFLLLSAFLFGILLNSCEQESTSPEFESLSGIIEYEDGSPVSGILLYAGDETFNIVYSTDTSNASGEFYLDKLPKDLSQVFIKTLFNNEINSINNAQELKSKSSDSKIRLKFLENDSCCATLTVIVKSGEEYLNEAEVRLNKGQDIIAKKYTNDYGKVVFENVCEGSFWIRIAKDGYDVKEEEISLDSCESKEVNINLEKKETDNCCGKIIFKVWNKDKTEELANTEIKLVKGETIIGKNKTDENGNLVYEGLCEGKYLIRAEKEGYKVFETYIELDSCQTKEKEILLDKKETENCCGKLQVLVKDKISGEPLKNSEVKLTIEGTIFEKLFTDADGYVKFDGLCLNKTYYIRIARDGYNVIEDEIKVETCETWKEITVQLEKKETENCCGKLQVLVKDKISGEPLKNSEVKLTIEGTIFEKLFTDADGYVKFDGLCLNKTYYIHIARDGYKVIEDEIKVETCETWKEITVQLEKKEYENCCNNKIKVIVRDSETNELIKGAKVRLWQDGELLREKTIENEGIFFAEVCKGTYWVDIIHEDYNDMEWEVTVNCEETKAFEKKLSKK